MKYRKFNKLEKAEVRQQMMDNALHGEGVYLFRNNANADLTLPRPTKSGIRVIGPGKEFQGDNYYMQLVKTGMLRLVKEIISPEQQRAALEESTMQEKLILDQPDMVTEQGKVEHVVSQPATKLNETESTTEQKPVLLNEGPVESGFVFVGQ